MTYSVEEEIASRELWKALLNTPAGQRATFRLLARYEDDAAMEADVASMTDREVLMLARKIGGRR